MPGLLRARRLAIFLPVNSPGERYAAAQVASFARDRFGGVTHTPFQPSVLRGYWVEGDILYIDEIALVLVDMDDAQGAQEPLENAMTSIRMAALRAYEDAGSPQLEIWLTAGSIERFTG